MYLTALADIPNLEFHRGIVSQDAAPSQGTDTVKGGCYWTALLGIMQLNKTDMSHTPMVDGSQVRLVPAH